MAGVKEVRVPVWRRSWCRYRPFIHAGVSLLEFVAVAPLLLEATSVGMIFFLMLAMALLSALLKAHFARGLSRHLAHQKERLQAFRDGKGRNSRAAVTRAKSAWIKASLVLPILSVVSLGLYVAAMQSMLEQCGTASPTSFAAWVSCHYRPVVVLLMTLNASEIMEFIADTLLSLALKFEDVYPGLDASVQVPVVIVRHNPLNMPDDTDNLCAICLDDFVEGETVGQLACRHQFHEACLGKWLLEGSCCPFRCPVVETTTMDSNSTDHA